MKVLVTGWFSFEQMGASAGDLLSRDLACKWLEEAGYAYDVALAAPFFGGVDWREIPRKSYSHVLFICGPFGNGSPLTEFLLRFKHCHLVGLNLSMLEPLETWNPFDFLLERDSSACSRPDMVFLSHRPLVPIVGTVLIDDQPEYGNRAQHARAHRAIQAFVESNDVSVVPIDTRLDVNRTDQRSPAQIESLIARMDVVLTTRLHGLVLSLKNEVPVVAIDSVSGGAKVSRQASVLGWPGLIGVDDLTEDRLGRLFRFCLTDSAREQARQCAKGARELLKDTQSSLIQSLGQMNP